MKLRTRKGVSKRIKITGTGKIITKKSNTNHLLMNKSKKSKNRFGYGKIISSNNLKKTKKQIPYN